MQISTFSKICREVLFVFGLLHGLELNISYFPVFQCLVQIICFLTFEFIRVNLSQHIYIYINIYSYGFADRLQIAAN